MWRAFALLRVLRSCLVLWDVVSCNVVSCAMQNSSYKPARLLYDLVVQLSMIMLYLLMVLQFGEPAHPICGTNCYTP